MLGLWCIIRESEQFLPQEWLKPLPLYPGQELLLTPHLHHQRGNSIINNGKVLQNDVIAQVNGECLYKDSQSKKLYSHRQPQTPIQKIALVPVCLHTHITVYVTHSDSSRLRATGW